MSPEQAKGKELDARTDLFSFGAVLYEMAAGRPAFQGTTTADVLAALLATEPDIHGLPAELAAILRKALAKQRANRQPAR